MDPIPSRLRPAVAATLEKWHACVAQRDTSDLASIVHPDAVFRSPMAFGPYSPAPALILVLSTVIQALEDFVYHRQFSSEDGLNAVLEFSAKVGERRLKGIDLIRFDEQGRIVEFEVMIRPLSGLQVLGEEMGKRLGHQLAAYRAHSAKSA
jgi:hypothetical protein